MYEQTFLDMYTEIHIDISHFNQDTNQNSATCQSAKNHTVFSQLSAALTIVQQSCAESVFILFCDCC